MDTIRILLVEDNPADIVFFQEAAAESGIPFVIDTVENGRDALWFLRCQGRYAHALRPHIMVLDLNLPLKNGREVLLEISQDPALNSIPVAILTTSDSEMHLCELYPPGRCVYFVKQFEFSSLVEIIRLIADHAHACT